MVSPPWILHRQQTSICWWKLGLWIPVRHSIAFQWMDPQYPHLILTSTCHIRSGVQPPYFLFFPLSFSNGFDVHRFTYSEFIDRGQTVKSEFHGKSWDSKEKVCWTSWTVVNQACGCCPAKSSQLQADQTAWLSTLKISCRNSLLFFMSNKNRQTPLSQLIHRGYSKLQISRVRGSRPALPVFLVQVDHFV